MGPLSAKSYPGREPVRPQPPPAGRARQEVDYGRRGKGYVFGAFCPATYSADEVATVIAAALTSPRSLGLPFAAWTLDRLAAYLLERKGIAMRRSRIGEILLKEGLRWRRQETWFGERVDPEFAEKRGGSRRSTPRHPRAA